MTSKRTFPHFLLFSLLLLSIMFALPNSSASADMGPKESVTILVTNAPNKPYYIDLLYTPYDPEGDLRSNLREPESYNPDMLTMLRSFETDDKKLVMVTGTFAPVFGDFFKESLPEQTQKRHGFSYFGLPETFQIVLVSESGYKIISPVVTRERFSTTMHFDAATGIVKQTARAYYVITTFLSTLIPTLLIEGLILLLFKFDMKENWKVFLLVNLATQIGLHSIFLLFGNAEYSISFFWLLLPMEAVIMLIESFAYGFLLKGHSTGRRVVYGIVANLISFILGLFINAYTEAWINMI